MLYTVPDFVISHGPGSGDLPSVRTISQLHLLEARLSDLLVLVIYGADRKFVPIK